MITPTSNSVYQETVSEAVERILGQRNLVMEQVRREESRTHELQTMNVNVQSQQGQKKKNFIGEHLSKKSF